MPHATNFADFFQENKDLVKEYIETRIELLKLQALRSSTRLLTLLVAIFFASSLFLCVLLFLGISFSWWMASITQSNTIGFLCGAGLFLVITLIVIALRKKLFRGFLIRLFIRDTISEWREQEDKS
jgi:hypothetical protein